MTPARGESVISCANDQAVWPWQREPYRLWSLLDMMEAFGAGDFAILLGNLERACSWTQMLLEPPPVNATTDQLLRTALPRYREALEGLVMVCDSANVPISHNVVMQLQRLYAKTREPNPDYRTIVEHALVARQALIDDLSQHLFLAVDSHSAARYREPLADWNEVVSSFGCSFDIEEGQKCFALGRYTAAVFHFMKVVESAVLELQMFLKESDVQAHFGSVLRKLENLTQKQKYDDVKEELKPYLEFMRDVLAQLHAVKDSWRDKVAHVDARIIPMETFTEELAKGVHDATLLLMKKLADGLPPAAKV